MRWPSIALFLVLTFLLAWAAFIGLRGVLAFNLRATIGMYAPVVSALITRLALREGFADFGLRPSRGRSWRWAYPVAYLLPIGLTLVGAILAVLAREQHWVLYQRWELVLNQIGARAPRASAAIHRAGAALLFAQIVEDLTLVVLVNCLATLGEEFGWRGHLLPRLLPLGEVWAAVLAGVVWGLWHAPLVALDGYEFGIKSWAAAPYFCLFTVPFGTILAWLRLRSGSTWPCVLAHASVNAIASLVAALLLTRAASTLLGSPVGVLGCAPFWAFAIWLTATRRLRFGRHPKTAREPGVAGS